MQAPHCPDSNDDLPLNLRNCDEGSQGNRPSNIDRLNDELVDVENELWNMSFDLPQVLDSKKYANDPQKKVWFIKQIQKKESYLIQSLEQEKRLERKSRIYKQLEQELTDVQNVIMTMSSDLPPVLDGKEDTQMNPFNPSNKFSDNCTTAQTYLPSSSGTIEDPYGITNQEISSQEKLEDVIEPEFSDNCTNALSQTSLPSTSDTVEDKEKNKTNTFNPSNQFCDNCTNTLSQRSLPSTTSDTIEDPSGITKQEIVSQEKLGEVLEPEFKRRRI